MKITKPGHKRVRLLNEKMITEKLIKRVIIIWFD